MAVVVALFVPLEVNTGTTVRLTAIALFIPLLSLLWLLDMVRRRTHLVASRTNLPLLLFLVMGLVSLLVGIVTWDPTVPRNANFTLVQLAQWGIFVLSALAFWLTANLIRNEAQLERLTWIFLWLAGILALVSAVTGAGVLVDRVTTVALIRPPFWVLLTGLSAGQALFNARLSRSKRIYLGAVLLAVLFYAFVQQRESVSNWVGVTATLAVLLWLRIPRVRGIIVVLLVAAMLTGILFPTVYDFAGGDAEWQESGGSRLVLIERVVSVTMRNPITGLGPAAYRPYTSMQPLPYGHALWITPQVNSHNNWVDLFSHVGLVGVGLFLWFVLEVIRSAQAVRSQQQDGFRAGFASGMLATWIGALVIMLLADWILPFVYNIGFEGFPASVLLWLFLGGLVVLEQLPLGQLNEEGQ
ncbi:MAG: O-antigen ligase family protein [Anaerolineae bacterium]|nr:O-antigen ligase family protein [Anaerolineae bacterium]